MNIIIMGLNAVEAINRATWMEKNQLPYRRHHMKGKSRYQKPNRPYNRVLLLRIASLLLVTVDKLMLACLIYSYNNLNYFDTMAIIMKRKYEQLRNGKVTVLLLT